MSRNSLKLVLPLVGLFLGLTPGGYAQQGAAQNSAPVPAGASVRGDLDGDRRVTAADAQLLRDYLVGKGLHPDAQHLLLVGDVNGDGRLTAVDATIIARFAAGHDVSRFPVGQPLVDTPQEAGLDILAQMVCTARVDTKSIACESARPQAPGRPELIVGGQNLYVKLTSSNVVVVPGGNFSFDVTVQNLIPQPLGTTDGTTPHANGVRVFFHSGPTNTTAGAPGGMVSVSNPDGTGTFTGTNQPYFQYSGTALGPDGILSQNETSNTRNWVISRSGGVNTFVFTVYVAAEVQYPDGWISLYPVAAPTDRTPGLRSDTLWMDEPALQLVDTIRGPAGNTGGKYAGTTTWSSSNTGVVTVSSSGLVTQVAPGTATVTATSGPRTGAVNFVVRQFQANGDTFSQTVTGNVGVNTANTSPSLSATSNDVFRDGTTISFFGWQGTSGKSQQGGDVSVTTSGADMGKFTYNPPAGYEGADSVEYTITHGSTSSTAKVAITVSGMIWFIDNGAASCTTRASGCGRLTSPYSSLAGFAAENDGTGNNPAANDNIFLYQSGTGYGASLTLLNGQKLIGQDASASLSTITGISPITGSDALPTMDTGGAAVTLNGADGINLGSNNTLRGLTLANTAGEAIGGTSFGTLTLADGSTQATDVTISASGQALSLTTGTIAGNFASVGSTGGTNNVSLTSVNSSGTLTLGGTLSGATGTSINVSGGNVSLTHAGNVTQGNAAALLSVSGSHTGTLTFNTGTLSATAGTGLQFDNADGTYNFNGTTTLNGGDAAIDVLNGSGGTFTFGSGASITSPTNHVVQIANSSPTFSYAGSFSKSSTGVGIALTSNNGGTVTFSGSSQSLSTSTSNAVSMTSNTGTTLNFTGGNLALTTTSGIGLNASNGGTLVVTGANNTINSTAGTALSVSSVAIGGSGLTFKSISAAGGTNGIVLSSTGSGGLTVTGDGASSSGNTTRGRTTVGSSGTLVLGSGGTISNTTGDGISLTSAQDVVLRNMVISGAGGTTVDGTKNGIDAQSVTNLTVDNTYITGSAGNSGLYASSVSGLALTHVEINNNATTSGVENGGVSISNVDLNNVTGTLTVSNSLIANSRLNAFDLINSSGTVTAVVSNSEFHNASISRRGNNAFSVEGHGTANISTNITGSSFHDVAAKGFQYVSDGSAGGGTLSIATSSFEMSNSAISISHGGQGGTDLKFNINGNSIRQNTTDVYTDDGVSTTSTAIITQLNSASAVGADLIGYIQNNTIGASSTSKASATGFGINVDHYGQGNATIQISGNVIRDIGSSSAAGIFWGMGVCSTSTSANCSSRVGNLTVSGNDVYSTVNGLSGVNVANGTNSGDAGTLCLHIGSSSTASPLNTRFSVPAGTGRRGVRVSVNHGGVTRLQNYTGATYTSGPATDANTFLNSTQVATTISPNTLAPVVFGTTDSGRKVEPAPSACSTPVL